MLTYDEWLADQPNRDDDIVISVESVLWIMDEVQDQDNDVSRKVYKGFFNAMLQIGYQEYREREE